jgi:hypothetical protein
MSMRLDSSSTAWNARPIDDWVRVLERIDSLVPCKRKIVAKGAGSIYRGANLFLDTNERALRSRGIGKHLFDDLFNDLSRRQRLPLAERGLVFLPSCATVQQTPAGRLARIPRIEDPIQGGRQSGSWPITVGRKLDRPLHARHPEISRPVTARPSPTPGDWRQNRARQR